MLFADQIYSDGVDARTVRDWCKLLDISYHTVKSRHSRGATSFETLFKVKPVQLRRLDTLNAKHAEATFRAVDLLEIMFGQVLKERIMDYAKASAIETGQEYSITNTLYELVKLGLIHVNQNLDKHEALKAEEIAITRANFPNGIPDQVISGNTYGWKVSEPRQDVVYTTPFKPMTPEEAADIGDW
jgi:hypothetical protein